MKKLSILCLLLLTGCNLWQCDEPVKKDVVKENPGKWDEGFSYIDSFFDYHMAVIYAERLIWSVKHAIGRYFLRKFTQVFIIATTATQLMSLKMTGEEALRIFQKMTIIYNHLILNQDRQAFFEMGTLTEELAQIIRTDQVSFNPTIEKENESV